MWQADRLVTKYFILNNSIMKITDIRAKKYAAWHDLNLPLHNQPINLFYGPNEAGKTTLMRMIRGLLYGFKTYGEPSQQGVTDSKEWEGSLRIKQDGRRYKIRRRWREGARGEASIKAINDNNHQRLQLDKLLSGVSESIYERVYALGLYELQELATLHADDVADHIYGMTLGPEGQQLRAIAEEINQHKRRLLSANARQGEIASLLDQEDRINNDISLLTVPLHKHRDFSKERESLNKQIANLQSRQQTIERELNGHRFLVKLWNPWNQVREYSRKIDQLPSQHYFSADNIARLRKLEEEERLTKNRHQQLQLQHDDLQKRFSSLNYDSSFLKHEPEINSLHNLLGWFETIDRDNEQGKRGVESERSVL